jgi:hypothetical protein
LTPDRVADIVTSSVLVGRGDILRAASGQLPAGLFRSMSPEQAQAVRDQLVAAGALAEVQTA